MTLSKILALVALLFVILAVAIGTPYFIPAAIACLAVAILI